MDDTQIHDHIEQLVAEEHSCTTGLDKAQR